MDLQTWLTENEMTATAFAEKAGVAVSTITRAIRRERRPDWDTLEAIGRATGGAVTPNDFMADNPAASAA